MHTFQDISRTLITKKKWFQKRWSNWDIGNLGNEWQKWNYFGWKNENILNEKNPTWSVINGYLFGRIVHHNLSKKSIFKLGLIKWSQIL